MGKASRNKRERASIIPATHEPEVPQDWPDGHVNVELTGDDVGECIVITVHGVRHFLHSTTALALNQRLGARIAEWDAHAKAHGAPGVLPRGAAESSNGGSDLFAPSKVASALTEARGLTKPMVRGALATFATDGAMTADHLAFLGFVERAQAFHEGVLDMVESGNPLGAATLLRSFAENLAVAFYLEKHPSEIEKLRPGAERGFKMGRVTAAAGASLPGFKDLYDHLSNMAHPSGAGAFQTLRIDDDGAFSWQSKPTFRTADEALSMLRWLEEIRELTEGVIAQTAAEFDVAAQARRDDPLPEVLPDTPSLP